MDAINQVLQQLSPNNYQTPILGSIRKFNADTFGTPSYADPKATEQQRMMDLVMALGVHGGKPSAKFAKALRDAVPQWASASMLNRIPSKVPGFYQSAGNPNKLVSARPSINEAVNPNDVNFEKVIGNAIKLIRK